ncbi:MAG: GntR family transcriptional regulator, partial [Betaproteobacteria bacterium]|nr:GntR family transcriptional regulator [Betaproteobacteria bacterium]
MTFLLTSAPPIGQSLYGTLADALRQRILNGEWQPGQMIPSEASLAQRYGVALGTLRQALSLL